MRCPARFGRRESPRPRCGVHSATRQLWDRTRPVGSISSSPATSVFNVPTACRPWCRIIELIVERGGQGRAPVDANSEVEHGLRWWARGPWHQIECGLDRVLDIAERCEHSFTDRLDDGPAPGTNRVAQVLEVLVYHGEAPCISQIVVERIGLS